MKTHSEQTGIMMTTRALIAAVALCGGTATAQAQQGLTLNYYAGHTGSGLLNDGTGNPLSTLLALTPTLTSNYTGSINYPTMPSVGLGITSGQSVNYSLLWTGWFNAPVAGIYGFNTTSDDGSIVYIDLNGDGVFTSPGEIVVNNNSDHGATTQSGTVALSAQSYRIAIAYYQNGGGDAMSAQYQLPSGSFAYMDTASGLFFLTDPNAGSAPVVHNLSVTNVQTTSATLQGYLANTGGAPATVSVLWDTTDGSTNGTWANTNSWPAGTWWSLSSPSTNIALTAGMNYYYTFCGANSLGTNTATPSQYFITGELGLSVTDTNLGTSISDTATVVVSRPGACTNQALTVYYTLGGAAVNGSDYSASPASGFTLAAGQTNATITLTPNVPLNTSGSDKSVVLTLVPGAYAIGAAGTATCTLVNTVYVPPAIVLDGDVYVDPNANGTVKRYSDDSFVLWPCSVNTNVDGVAYNYM